MRETSVISILKTLSKEEIKEFDKFIISPFFNNQPSLTRFYNELKKFHPAFPDEKLDRKIVFQRLYPGKEFSDETIRRFSSDLKKILDEYMYYKAREDSNPETRFLKAMQYLKRGLIKEAQKELEHINKTLNQSGLISHQYIRNKLEYEDLTVQIGLGSNRQDLVADNFLNEVEYLIYNFLLRFTYYIHNINANKLIFNLSGDNFIKDFISSVDFEKMSGFIGRETTSKNFNKAMRIYILIILNNLHENEEKYFIEMKELLPDIIMFFTDHEKYNIYQLAEAICWRKMETINREKYRRELFEINKLRLTAGVYSPDGKNMRLLFYRQALMNALHIKEYDWAKEFVNKYSDKLPAALRENMRKFSEAHILFETGEFESSLLLLSKVDFDIFTLKYDLRNLLLRIYIELNYIEEAISLIDSYKRFIKNNKNVSEYYRTLINNLLKYCRLVIDLRLKKEGLEKEIVLHEIENENSLNYKVWLKEKIESA